jgi:serine/threonine protein kinase
VNSGSLALPWIAMELVHGLPLDAYIADRRPDVPAVLRIFVELCAAIDHAHERSIVHRDLKPSNVLVEPNGRPRVLDFGVARVSGVLEGAWGHHTRTGTVVGTLAYMSPEQARGERDSIDVRTDVYALGALLYESLTGSTAHAIDDLDLIEAAHVVCFSDPVPPSRVRAGLSTDLDAITGKAMEKDAPRRYATARELSADIQNFLAHRPVRARRPTRIDRLRKTVHRNPALTTALIVVFVSLTTALTIALVALRDQARQLAATTEAIDFVAIGRVGGAARPRTSPRRYGRHPRKRRSPSPGGDRARARPQYPWTRGHVAPRRPSPRTAPSKAGRSTVARAC